MHLYLKWMIRLFFQHCTALHCCWKPHHNTLPGSNISKMVQKKNLILILTCNYLLETSPNILPLAVAVNTYCSDTTKKRNEKLLPFENFPSFYANIYCTPLKYFPFLCQIPHRLSVKMTSSLIAGSGVSCSAHRLIARQLHTRQLLEPQPGRAGIFEQAWIKPRCSLWCLEWDPSRAALYPLLTRVCTSKGVRHRKKKKRWLNSPYRFKSCVPSQSSECSFTPLEATLCLSFQQTDFSTCSSVKGVHALLLLIKAYSISCLYQRLTRISILLRISQFLLLRFPFTQTKQ